ncbi:hypothetical protein QL285_090429 [Trifolium repens]|nr:hypothetical protein QL285_090429 [Trifolium repens]
MRPKKRPRNVQKYMETLFPVEWLSDTRFPMTLTPPETNKARRLHPPPKQQRGWGAEPSHISSEQHMGKLSKSPSDLRRRIQQLDYRQTHSC